MTPRPGDPLFRKLLGNKDLALCYIICNIPEAVL